MWWVKCDDVCSCFDLIGITEMWWNGSHDWTSAMERYRLFRTDRLRRRGRGVALYVREQLEYKEFCLGIDDEPEGAGWYHCEATLCNLWLTTAIGRSAWRLENSKRHSSLQAGGPRELQASPTKLDPLEGDGAASPRNHFQACERKQSAERVSTDSPCTNYDWQTW